MKKIDLQKVCFVCTGNIFRSLFAEKYYLQEISKKYIHSMACSRGTEIFYRHPNQKIVAWAKNFGLDLSGHNPMEISPRDMKDTTVFFVMDQSHYEYLKKISKDAQIYYLGNFSTTDKHDITDVKVRDLTIKKKEVIDTFRYIINAIDNILDTYGKIHTNNRHSCL